MSPKLIWLKWQRETRNYNEHVKCLIERLAQMVIEFQ